MENLNKLRDIDALKISLASAEEIQSWSYGEVLKPETINYRTFKPEKDGLFCERIFGPVKDYECYCGKYKRIRYKGVVCDRCGVQVTTSKVRRERMGHINLISPVAHVWMFKNIPSIMATLLGIAPRSLELVVYFSSFIVTDIDHDSKKALMKTFDERAKEAREKAQVTFEEQIDAMYQEAEEKVKSLSTEAEKKWKEEKLIHKAKEIREKANLKVDELQKTKHMELERAELEVRKIQKKLQEVEMHTVMSDREYLDLEEYLDEFCEVSIGAEAVQKILEKFDVQALAEELREELKKAGASKIDRVRKRLKIAESFIRGNVDPRNMIITALPVIPPDLRPMVMLEGGRFATSDLNDLYRRIINRNNRLKRLVELGAPDIIVRNEKRMLQEAVDALFDSSKVRKSRTRDRKTYRSIADAIKGKQGHFRANLLGKRVDYSGRAVIVAGPSLKVNECGLPKEMALELFRPFLIREIMNRGLAPNMKTAKYVLEERGDAVYDILEELVKTRPVLLNRAPTLHRLSVQAFYPKLISEKAIQLHPVVCAGFNADFDGDQMAVHLPLSDEAVEEALDLMLASKNLLKPADGSVTSIPSHEMVLGIYYLTSINEHLPLSKTIFSNESEVLRAIGTKAIDLRQKIRMQLNGEIIETTAGRVIFNEMLPADLRYMNIAIGKSKVKDIVKSTLEKYGAEVAIDLIDDLKLSGFKYSTLSGISLSIFDCGRPEDLDEVVAKGKEESAKIEQNYYMGLITRNELSKLSYKIWQKVLDHFDETILQSIDSENPVKLVITAGAGKASAVQIRQISAIKGLITDPNGKVIDVPVFGNYANGMSSFDYFLTGRGTRKSYMDKGLGTADAGYLTRRLVNVAQDVLVREADCGTKQGRTVRRGEDTPLATWANRLIGRSVMKDVKDGDTVLVKKGELVTAAQAKAIDAASSISEVVIRSALTCETPYGVCEKCYGTDLSVNEPGQIGLAAGIIAAQSIGEPGTQLSMQTFHAGGIARADITQGLPRVEELFEARKPRAQAIMSPIAGVVSIEENEDFTIITITPNDKKEELVVIKIESHEELTVSDKSSVSVGTQLTSGALNLQELFDMLGTTATQMYLLDEAQRVYGSQGVAINDKHVEIIIRQMCNRVRVKKAGTTGFLPGDIVTKYKLAEENEKAKELGGEPAEAEPILLGISRISRMSESWLDAASFEETSNVLTESAIAGSIDRLIGLKENVIIGRRIPVGDAARVPEAVDSSET